MMMNGQRGRRTIISMHLLVLLAWSTPLFAGIDTAAVVSSGTADNALMFDEQQQPEFRLSEPGTVNYVVKNQNNDVAASGTAETELRLPRLPRGYYRIYLSAAGKDFDGFRDFSVIADQSLRDTPDSPYGMMIAPRGAFTDFNRPVTELLDYFAALGKRSGLKTGRSILRWKQINPAPDKPFDFSGYDPEFDAYQKKGIKATWIWDAAPEWTRKGKENFTRDLKAVYEATRATATRYRGKAAAWEFWNEQDLSGSFNGTPWEYAAMAKAAYLGFKAGDPETPVTAGSFCVWPVNALPNELLNNGLAAYTDVLNWHCYQGLNNYRPLIEKIRSIQNQYGMTGTPIWITENGTNAEDSAELPNKLRSQLKSLSPDQEMLWAEMIPKGQILFQSLGVERTFTFIMRSHHERNGSKEWGMLRNDFTAKPALPAFATLVNELAGLDYEGELKLSPELQAYLYRQEDGRQTLAVWANSALDTAAASPIRKNLRVNEIKCPVSIRCDAKDARAVDHFGTPVALKADPEKLEFTANRYITYIHDLSGLTPTVSRPHVKTARTPAAEIDKTVVLAADCGESGRQIRLEAWNFDTVEKKGRIFANPEVSGLPETIVIPPMDKVVFPVSPIGKTNRPRLTFNGTFNGRNISPLAIDTVIFGRVEGVPAPQFMNREFWTPRGSAPVTMSFDEQEKALRFEMESPAENRWVYPDFNLEKAGVSLTGYMAVSFEIKIMQVPDLISNPTLCWFTFRDGPAIRCNQTPSVGEWRRNTILFPTANPASIRSIQIGLNPKMEKIVYYIRNVTLIPGQQD